MSSVSFTDEESPRSLKGDELAAVLGHLVEEQDRRHVGELLERSAADAAPLWELAAWTRERA